MDWFEKLNFAAWKYRNTLSVAGGPIERIGISKVELNGDDYCFEAIAFLKDEFRTNETTKTLVYGDADGTGSSKYKHVACHKAVSEALERWALYECLRTRRLGQFGFDVDPTSTGMAAFPGVLRCAPRSIAFREAIERWTLSAWWEGHLSCRLLSSVGQPSGAIELVSPWVGFSTVVLWQMTKSGNWAYGFATHRNLVQSSEKARVELLRNVEVLDRFSSTISRRIDASDIRHPSRVSEKRLLFFSSDVGFEAFLRRVRVSNEEEPSRFDKSSPSLLVDREIRGPWSAYASVWRCLFDPVSNRHFSSEIEYFLF